MSAPDRTMVLHPENANMRAKLHCFEADIFFALALFHFDPSGVLPEIAPTPSASL